MKRTSFWGWVGNNGVMSNLLSGAIVSVGSYLIWFVVGKAVDNPVVPVIAAILAAAIAIGVSWLVYWRFHSGEAFWAKECRLEAPQPSRIESNKAFVSDFEKERDEFQNWLETWEHAQPGQANEGETSVVCIVTGKKNAGRSSIVLHVGLPKVWDPKATHQDKVLYVSSGFQCRPAETAEQGREAWRKDLVRWVKSTSKKTKYFLLISSKDIGVEDILPAKEKANALRRSVCFILKDPVKDPEPSALDDSATPRTFDIHELTPEQCLSFLYKYAAKTRRLKELEKLKEVYRKREGKEEYGTWFKSCSGGLPFRLIRLFNNYGSSRGDIVEVFLAELKAKSGRIGQSELAFLWCLCLEKGRITLRGGNGIIAINQICARLNCLGGDNPTGLACSLFNEKGLTGSCSLAVLKDYFAGAAIQIPEEFFVASLGSWGDGHGCQSGIAEWVKSMLQEDETGDLAREYAEVAATAIFETLMCTGFLGTASPYRDVKECITAIDRLDNHIGVSGNPGLDGKTKHFLRSLKGRIGQKIIEACLDNLGFGDDANIVAVFSAILDACEERELFLECYAMALPLFGLITCDPTGIPAVSRFREILSKPEAGETGDANGILLRALLFETFYLCCIRQGYENTEQARETLWNPENGLGVHVESLANGGDKTSAALIRLAVHFRRNDVQSFAGEMKTALRWMGEPQWDGLKTMLAVSLAHLADASAAIDDKIWKTLLTEVENCRFPLDPENKVEKAVLFSVMMRRAFYKYRDNNSFDPWIIDVKEQGQAEPGRGETRKSVAVRLGATQRHKMWVSDLTTNDILRNLPAIVRQFAEGTCAKKRGLAEYEETLETGWKKINEIVTGEKWFDSINRRSRYLILFWSSKIVRDVMDESEQWMFLSRLKSMCNEVVSCKEIGGNVLYRLLALRTMGNVVKDKPLLNKIAAFATHFLLDDYPRLIDKGQSEELWAWYNIAKELFFDYLHDVSEMPEPVEIFKTILGVLSDSTIKTHAEAIRVYCGFSWELCEPMDTAFQGMLLDMWNKIINRIPIPDSLAFVDECFDGALMEKFKSQFADMRDRGPEHGDRQIPTLQMISRIVAIRLSRGADLDGRMLEYVGFCAQNCDSLAAYEDIGQNLKFFISICDQSDNPGAKQMAEPCREVCGKWDRELAQNLSLLIMREYDNVEDEHQFLRNIWATHLDVIKMLPEEAQCQLLGNLERTLERYSSKWQEGLRSDWYHAISRMVQSGILAKSSDHLLGELEGLFFEGDFEKHCPQVRGQAFFLVDILLALAEARDKRQGEQMDALSKRYTESWTSLKMALGLVDLDGSVVAGCPEFLMEKIARLDELTEKWRGDLQP